MNNEDNNSALCSDCGNWPEDILILTCNHNLCLIWASKNLKNEASKSQHTFQTVVCNTWGLSTVLDPESATTLISMYHEIEEENASPAPRKTTYNIPDSPESRYSDHNSKYNESVYKRNTFESTKRPQTNEQQYCGEHSDELVNYYCFQCNCSNICAECVIHGAHKGHDVQTIKKAYPLVCSKLEDLKSSVNSKIEELINSQQKLDISKKDISSQVESVKKRISDVFNDLKQNIERKEQEMLREAEEFEEQNSKQIDHLLRLANGRAMNLSEHTQTIKEVLNQYGQHAACDFYSKNYQQIKESNTSDLPQLDQLASQAQARVQVNAQNISDVMEGLKNFKLDIGELGLQLNSNFTEPPGQRRSTVIYEERGKMTRSQGPANIFELGYKNNTSLKSSVAKTMNKLKQNMVVSDQKPQYYDMQPSKGANLRSSGVSEEYYQDREIYEDEEEDEEDFRFIHR